MTRPIFRRLRDLTLDDWIALFCLAVALKEFFTGDTNGLATVYMLLGFLFRRSDESSK